MELTRGVDPDLMDALEGVFHPVVMVWLDWPDGEVRAHSGVGTIDWDGEDWLGVGGFGDLSVPEEMLGMIATRASLSLVGVPPETFDRLSDPIRNRDGEILLGVTTVAGGNVLIGDPVPVFAGYMDAMRYRVGRGDEGEMVHAIHIDIGSGPRARAKSSVFHSPEDQKAKKPSDTAGRFLINVEAEAESLTWPE